MQHWQEYSCCKFHCIKAIDDRIESFESTSVLANRARSLEQQKDQLPWIKEFEEGEFSTMLNRPRLETEVSIPINSKNNCKSGQNDYSCIEFLPFDIS